LQTLGAYRSRMQEFIKKHKITLNIDKIASQGAIFENSFVGNSICGPSRASILTGKHSHINGFMANGDRFNPDQWTVAKELQKANYQTAVIGKWHLASLPTGFDDYKILPGQGMYYNPDFISKGSSKLVRKQGYCSDVIGDLTIEWLDKKRDKSKPFFLCSWHKAPHRTWLPHPRHFNLLDGIDVPEPENLFDDYKGRTSSALEQEMTIRDHINIATDVKVTPPAATTSAEDIKKAINGIPIDDLIEYWDQLASEEELRFFSLLNLDRKVDLINSLPSSSQETLVTDLSVEHKRVLLEEMEPDDLTDFMQAISPEVRDAVWKSLGDEAKQETLFLLKFDEDDAAGLMTPRYLALSSSLNVSQALGRVRKNAADVETVSYIYVVDQLKRLRGVVSLRHILTARDEDLIEDIMIKKVVTVREDTDQEAAARILETHDFVALPVVDDYNRLLGIITFDDVIDVIREEQTEDIYKMGAMGGGTERYLESSIWSLIGKRVPWLGILLVAATLTTNVLSYFESLFVAATVLTLFIPTIIGTGGNSGTQSATLIIRGLAMGELHFHDFGRVLVKEIAVAMVIGICMGALIVVRSVFLPPFIEMHEAITIGVALSFVIVFATLVGASAPLIINRMGMDPTVMAAPLMATLIDIAGLTVYFLTARLLLGLH